MSDKEFIPTWLMIKRHALTNLLYFCKTNRQDPDKYKGSGYYWKQHIKKYGKTNVRTVWKELFTKKEDAVEFATAFSELFDIVESPEWANLIPETALDNNTGSTRSLAQRKVQSVKIKQWIKNNPEEVSRIQKAGAATLRQLYIDNPSLRMKHSQPGESNPMYGAVRSPDWCKQHSKRMTGTNNPMFGKTSHNKGKKLSDEHIAKLVGPRGPQQHPAAKVVCPHCGRSGIPSNMKRWHFDNCKFKGKVNE